ncbi:hypothetical protein [Enterococcus gallinarum]|uniref:hypothetical protein n=1 Tax=Enterococcus gallinarum TaxID=1353 RepID=UPI001AD642A5|nr:hypothetical protein [Enterococcus gallinarum]MBO6420038.1 hypothetical protein [Enterococcus gallinarum]MBO6423035.1 hypothetical protein [Enterococcus gallinarum]
MNKKSVSILLTLGLVIAFVLGYVIIKSNQSTTDTTSTSTSMKTELTILPTFEELKAEKGANLSDIGKVQVSTVIFQDVNQAILTNEKGQEIKVPLAITNKETKEFSLSSIAYTPDNLRIGDSFGLAELDSHYYAYSDK